MIRSGSTDSARVNAQSPRPTSSKVSPPLIGLIFGISTAIPMYLWQSSIESAIATFLIAGYIAFVGLASHNDIAHLAQHRSQLRLMSCNRLSRRVKRLALMPGFWWNVCFGGGIVTGSLWYAGLQDPGALAQVGGAWFAIAVCLNYGASMLHPTTRCRHCGYQLVGQLAASPGAPRVRCPECGRKATLADMGVHVGQSMRRAA